MSEDLHVEGLDESGELIECIVDETQRKRLPKCKELTSEIMSLTCLRMIWFTNNY